MTHTIELPRGVSTFVGIGDEFRALLNIPRPDAAPESCDPEELSREYIAEAKRRDARARWEHFCPPAYRATNWEDPHLISFQEQIGRIRGYQVSSKGLLASGPTQRGKTRAMWSLMQRLACDEARDCRYFHSSEFFGELQSRLNYGKDEAAGWIEAAASRPIVFIDDLGQEAISSTRDDWAKACFFRFLEIRLGNGLPLFVTTNLTAQEMAASCGVKSAIRGDPLVRRLLDVCEPVVFETVAERAARATRQQQQQ